MSQRCAQIQQPKLRKADSIVAGEDFDFLASQQSTGSDDHALQLAVAQQLMASKEKKPKDLEKKFSLAAKSKLTNEEILIPLKTSAAADDVKHPVSEDMIRALWMEIKHEEQKLVGIAKKQRTANEALRTTTERAQIVGMARRVMTRSIIKGLLPTIMAD
ncbi:hypothetical protein C8R44DRAFT_728385 [Mycena epipterygia]|nr:hypothetical protein C8R44DRAFT_728385 [Mycena epipterygia]